LAAKGSQPELSKAATERLERTRIEQRYTALATAIRWAGIVGSVYFAGQAVQAYAGRDTSIFVNAALSLLANLNLTVAISLTGAATVWAVCERYLRRRKVEKMQARIRELELLLDPARTSSGLLKDGRTNPRDMKRS
jgi:hypothetical protein